MIRSMSRSTASGTRGFTMVELVIVLVILGIIFSFAAPRLGGLTPKYRLRSYSRQVASSIEKARVSAIVRGRTTGIRYVLDDIESQGCHIVPPAPLDFPEQPLDHRDPLSPIVPPPGVRIRGVLLPGGGGEITSGVVNVGFSPAGTTGSHIVILEAKLDDETTSVIAIKYNSISGILDYYNEPVDFQHYQG